MNNSNYSLQPAGQGLSCLGQLLKEFELFLLSVSHSPASCPYSSPDQVLLLAMVLTGIRCFRGRSCGLSKAERIMVGLKDDGDAHI